MSTIILTKGLPASGKTTWAREFIQNRPEYINLCQDDLRLTLPATKIREHKVIELRNTLTREALQAGQSVIWSDTNLEPLHELTAQSIAKEFGVAVEIKSFSDVPLAECMDRDNARAGGVGESAIKKMYNTWLRPKPPIIKYNSSIPDCYIFDIDGTVALKGDRSPYDWSKVGLDYPNPNIIKIAELLLKAGEKVIFLSGRDSVCRLATEAWLHHYIQQSESCELYMRPESDMSPDWIIKEELYRHAIVGRYNVVAIFDDRPSVCRMWRSLGLMLAQVADPEIEF